MEDLKDKTYQRLNAIGVRGDLVDNLFKGFIGGRRRENDEESKQSSDSMSLYSE